MLNNFKESMSIKNIKGLEKVRQAWNLKVTQGELNSLNEIESFGHAINEKHSQFRFCAKKMKGCLNKLKNPDFHK